MKFTKQKVSKEREAGRSAATEVVFGTPYIEKESPMLSATFRGVELEMSLSMDLGTSEIQFALGRFNNPTKSKDWIRGFRESVDKQARQRFKVELLSNGKYKIGYRGVK